SIPGAPIYRRHARTALELLLPVALVGLSVGVCWSVLQPQIRATLGGSEQPGQRTVSGSAAPALPVPAAPTESAIAAAPTFARVVSPTIPPIPSASIAVAPPPAILPAPSASAAASEKASVPIVAKPKPPTKKVASPVPDDGRDFLFDPSKEVAR